MKVICINQSGPIPGHENVPDIYIGNEYEVIDSGYDNDIGYYYCLAEFGTRYGYSQSHFARISKIDETEMERNYNKSLMVVG